MKNGRSRAAQKAPPAPTYPDSIKAYVGAAKKQVKLLKRDEFKALVDQGKAGLIVDVRQENEFSDGYVPGAVNLPRGLIEFLIWAEVGFVFVVFLAGLQNVSKDLLEAATIDGASLFGIFVRIVLPVVTPGLSVLAILTFVNSFNEFLGPLLILSDPKNITAPLALANFRATQITAPRYSLMFAGSTLATLPLLIVFFSFQRQLISGIMSGAIKGGA